MMLSIPRILLICRILKLVLLLPIATTSVERCLLLLPIATTSVERCFSVVKIVKMDLQNRTGDGIMNDYAVCFVEQEFLDTIPNDDAIFHLIFIIWMTIPIV
jgi:hypothetical protein